MTTAIRQLRKEGHYVDPDDLSVLSPYIMEHIKLFGDYVIDLEELPQPFDGKLGLELKTAQMKGLLTLFTFSIYHAVFGLISDLPQ